MYSSASCCIQEYSLYSGVGNLCERQSERAVAHPNPQNRAGFLQVQDTGCSSPRGTPGTYQPHQTPRVYSTQPKGENYRPKERIIHSSCPTFLSSSTTDPCTDLSLSEKQQRVGFPSCGLLHHSWAVALVPSYGPPELEPPIAVSLQGSPEPTITLSTRGLCGSR